MTFDRSRAPAPGAIRRFEFPVVDRRVLPSGLDLRVVRLARLPVASMSLVMDAGEGAVGASHAGLAVLTGDALEGGTRRRSGSELAQALERIGAQFSVGTGWDATTVNVSCLADRLPEALCLLAEAIQEPAFPEDEVARAREQRLAVLRQRAMDPSSMASDEAGRRFYPEGFPYARHMGGTEAGVSAMTPKHLRGFADAYYRPGRGGLVVAGDVDVDEVELLAREHLGGWRGTPPEHPSPAAGAASTRRALWIVDRAGAVQSEIRVGHVGASRSTEDYFPLLVLNTVLGGSFTSRLNLNLRERHGFTYGVRSRFSFRRLPGPFQVSTAVGTDVTAPAVGEIVRELEALVGEGATDAEISAARDFAAGVFPLRMETTGQIASRVAELLVYRLPEDFHRHYRDRIRGVTTAAANAAGRRHIRPSEAQVVVVGDADRVRGPLEALNLGPVEVVEPGERS